MAHVGMVIWLSDVLLATFYRAAHNVNDRHQPYGFGALDDLYKTCCRVGIH